MRFRKLRIAWSVVWGLAVVLLVVLWVRSYWWMDGIGHNNGTCVIDVQSASGSIVFEKANSPGGDLSVITSTAFASPFLPHTTFDFQDHLPSFAAVYLPHWFFTVLFTAVAAAPWVRFSFSLRTLLIATTHVAVVLGLVVWLLSP